MDLPPFLLDRFLATYEFAPPWGFTSAVRLRMHTIRRL